MSKGKATKQIGFRIPEELKVKIEQRAEEEGRTMSNLIINVLTKYLEEIENAKRILGG